MSEEKSNNTDPNENNEIKTLNFINRIKKESFGNSHLLKKIFFFVLLTWLPLLILSAIEGNASNKGINISFLSDYLANTKFLITLPLVLLAESVLIYLSARSINYFVQSGLVASNNINEFESLVNKYYKTLNSLKLKIIVGFLTIIYLVINESFYQSFGEITSWKYLTNENSKYSLAGYWLVIVSIPVAQYILFMMVSRFFMWTWFLWKVSNMDLNLRFTNPDKAGGLSFLGRTQLSFGALGFAQASYFSAQIADKVVYRNSQLIDFKVTIIIFIIFFSVLYLSPLLLFTRKLLKLKVKGQVGYGILASKYGSLFENKWIDNNDDIYDEEKDELLGSGDIQSLADLGGAYERIDEIKFVPLTTTIFVFMIILIAFPFVPLASLVLPFEELVKTLIGFLL